MKKMKKLVGILLTLAMVVAMSITTFAKPGTITISGGANGSEYAAYKLLNATDGGAGKYAYTLNTKYTSILETATEKTTEKEIVDYISELDTAATRTFADEIYKAIKSEKLAADGESGTSKEIAADTGYYLIVETKVGNTQDTYSLAMLGTVGNDGLTITTKEGTPKLEKKVQEKNDSTGATTDWQDGADYDLGDPVPFKLTGTVSDRYDSYGTYYYAFHDKMSDGLTLKEDSVKVSVDGTPITSGYNVVTTGFEDECTFEIRFDNLKAIENADGQKLVKSTSIITVEYTATLNGEAVIGSAGNPNEAHLEYSNNPYGEDTGKTPEDKVIVFTYKLVANKKDGSGNDLNGAGFTLYKLNNGSYEAVGAEIVGTENNPVHRFEFNRLDAGQYKLVETTVPAGYNKAEDLIFTVEATYDDNSAVPGFGSLVIKDKDGKVISDDKNKVFTVDISEGSATTDVVNLSGTELPSTGGMGTTILYVVGAILVIGAGILLVTKKRMGANK